MNPEGLSLGRLHRGLLLLVLCSACTSGLLQKEVRFSRAELQQKLETVFPVEGQKSLLRAHFSDPEVVLRTGGERIGLGLAVSVRLPGGNKLNGTLELDSALRYDPALGQILLTDPQLQDLTFDGLPHHLDSVLQSLAGVVVRRHLTQIPIYRLKADDYRKSLTRLVLKSVQVRDGEVIAVIGL